MIGWALSFLGGISLRTKLVLLAVAGVVSTMFYLWLRWKLAAKSAKTAQDKADKLEATRALEQRIAAGQASLRARQAKVRKEIFARQDRDYFER